jgi:hypothetical protein
MGGFIRNRGEAEAQSRRAGLAVQSISLLKVSLITIIPFQPKPDLPTTQIIRRGPELRLITTPEYIFIVRKNEP